MATSSGRQTLFPEGSIQMRSRFGRYALLYLVSVPFLAQTCASNRALAQQPASQATSPAPPAPAGSDGLVGNWLCIEPGPSLGVIKLDGHGGYSFGTDSGRYTVNGQKVT